MMDNLEQRAFLRGHEEALRDYLGIPVEETRRRRETMTNTRGVLRGWRGRLWRFGAWLIRRAMR